MRPLLPGSIGRSVGSSPDALAATRGAYCSICERPLISTGWVWSTDSGETYSPTGGDPPPLEAALLLCANCERDQATGKPIEPESLALPIRDATFTLDGSSPFVYEPVRLNLNLIDDEGQIDVEEANLVVVRATTERAQLTARLFGIDFGSGDRDELTLRREEWLSWDDPRARLRTEAWNSAHDVGHRLTERQVSVVELLGTRKLVSVVGFVSVWATVLRQYVDGDVVARLVGAVEIEAPSDLSAMVASTCDPFPGTDWDGFFGITRLGGLERPVPA